jgi:hypothetical protein
MDCQAVNRSIESRPYASRATSRLRQLKPFLSFPPSSSARCRRWCGPLSTTGRPNGSVVIQNAIVANGLLYVTTQDSASSGIGEVPAYGLP